MALTCAYRVRLIRTLWILLRQWKAASAMMDILEAQVDHARMSMSVLPMEERATVKTHAKTRKVDTVVVALFRGTSLIQLIVIVANVR